MPSVAPVDVYLKVQQGEKERRGVERVVMHSHHREVATPPP